MLQYESTSNKSYILKIHEGIAFLEINGISQHLDMPYLRVEYLPMGSSDKRVFAGYRIEGLFFGIAAPPPTTPRLIAILKFLGFSITATSFRQEMQHSWVLANKLSMQKIS